MIGRTGFSLLILGFLFSIALQGVCGGETEWPQQADDAVFHFVGNNHESEQIWPFGTLVCGYDFELGCKLESDVLGFQTYSVNWVKLSNQLCYAFEQPPLCPMCENYLLTFNSDDFDLSMGQSQVQLMAKGTFVNPLDEDIYTIWLTLKHDKLFVTPKGTSITFSKDLSGSEFVLGTDSTEAHTEFGTFYGYLSLPDPYEIGLPFGGMLLQDTPTMIRYIDADAIGGGVQARASGGDVIGAAADGASRVIVEISGAQTEPIVEIPEGGGEWEDSWQNWGFETWRRTWKAPADFYTLGPEYDHLGSRIIDFSFDIDGKAIDGPPFFLFKPPVLFLHGLFARETMWNAMKASLLNDYAGGDDLLLNSGNYDRDAHFADNLGTIDDLVNSTLKRVRAHRLANGPPTLVGQIAAQKVDIVAHSMGGILANLYVSNAKYDKDVNRIITIETPHSGSELANFILHFFFCELKLNQSKFWNLVWKVFEIADFSVTGGGVEDLQVGSSAIDNYREALLNTDGDVRVCPIAGLHEYGGPGFCIDQLYKELWGMDQTWNREVTYFHGDEYHPLSVEEGLFPRGVNSSDFVVSLDSQAGGLDEMTHSPELILDHVNTANDEEVARKVIELLRSPVSSFAGKFAPLSDYPDPAVGPVSNKECTSQIGQSELASGEPGIPKVLSTVLQITEPASGTVFAPGDSVTVEVSYSGQPYPKVVFLAAPRDSATDTLNPYQFVFAIDEDHVGPLLIAAAAISNDWETGDSLIDEVLISVVPPYPPTKIQLWPAGPLYLSAGGMCQLYVEGVFSDSLVGDITSCAVGTQYSSSVPSVATIGENGLISCLSTGETLIRVENGVAQEFYVIVDADTTVGITFASATATVNNSCVTLSWQMGVEVSVSDFQIERSESPDREFLELNLPVVQTSIHSFSCTDYSVVPDNRYWYRIVLQGASGREIYGPIEVYVAAAPSGFRLHQSYPNPFNPLCTIRYEIPRAGKVTLRVFDVAGSLVRTLVNSWRESGVYREAWDGSGDNGRNLPSGVYFYQLEGPGYAKTRKMVLLR